MEVLSVLNLGEFAHIFSKMGMFPVFDLAYYIVSILYLKYEPGEKKKPFCLLKVRVFSPGKSAVNRIIFKEFYLLWWLVRSRTYTCPKHAFIYISRK